MMYIPIHCTRKYCSIYATLLLLMLTSKTRSVQEGATLQLPLLLPYLVYCFIILLLMLFNPSPKMSYGQYKNAIAAEPYKVDKRRVKTLLIAICKHQH